MTGDVLIDWTDDGAPLGTARLLSGDYQSANFTLRRAGDSDGLAADDPVRGHTFHIEGVASQAGQSLPFQAVLDIDEGTRMIGALFPVRITDDATGPLVMQVLTVDPFEGDTMFDGVDFARLPLSGGGPRVDIVPGQDAHNILRRRVQVHDHYAIAVFTIP